MPLVAVVSLFCESV